MQAHSLDTAHSSISHGGLVADDGVRARRSLPSSAMMIVDENLQIVSADAAGRLLLAAQQGFRLSLGRLCTGSMTLNSRIRMAIAQKTAMQDLSLPSDSRTRMTVTISPISAMSGDVAGQALSQAIVLVSLVVDHSEDNIMAIRQQCGLTGAETETLRLIFKGFSTPEAASVLGIAKSTLRTHLQKIFAKTGASRQSELVHFVATFGHH